MPPESNEYDTAAATKTDALAEKWHTADPLRTGSSFPSDPLAEEVAAWPVSHVTAFLGRLLQFAGLNALKASTTRKMDAVYGFDAMRNPEARSLWLCRVFLILRVLDLAVFSSCVFLILRVFDHLPSL